MFFPGDRIACYNAFLIAGRPMIRHNEKYSMGLTTLFVCGGAAFFIVALLAVQFSWQRDECILAFVITFFLFIGLLVLSLRFAF
jgi:hypothetical protein